MGVRLERILARTWSASPQDGAPIFVSFFLSSLVSCEIRSRRGIEAGSMVTATRKVCIRRKNVAAPPTVSSFVRSFINLFARLASMFARSRTYRPFFSSLILFFFFAHVLSRLFDICRRCPQPCTTTTGVSIAVSSPLFPSSGFKSIRSEVQYVTRQ